MAEKKYRKCHICDFPYSKHHKLYVEARFKETPNKDGTYRWACDDCFKMAVSFLIAIHHGLEREWEEEKIMQSKIRRFI